MYSIQFSDWGLVLDFIGQVRQDLVDDWITDLQQLRGGFSEPFSVIVDLQQARPASRAVEEDLREGLVLLAQAGMKRAAVVLDEKGNVLWPRVSSVNKPAGIRQIVARPDSDWIVKAHAWVQRGLEPQSNESGERNGA